MLSFTPNYTDAQLLVIEASKDHSSVLALAAYSLQLGNTALEALVRLPHTNERGEKVVHGCNNAMRDLASACSENIRGLMNCVPYDSKAHDVMREAWLATPLADWKRGQMYLCTQTDHDKGVGA